MSQHVVICALLFVTCRDDEGMCSWELADVKANQSQKGRPLSKKQRQQRYSIPVAELQRVRIYVDF